MGFFIRFAFIYDFRNFSQRKWNPMKHQIPFHILLPVYSRATASAFIGTQIKKHFAKMRSLHPSDAERKGFGHSPTSILNLDFEIRFKNRKLVPSCTACDVDVSVNCCVRNFKSLQLCEDIVCAHAACQQLFQHVLCFSFLCGLRCFGFSLDLFGFDSGDFLVDRF